MLPLGKICISSTKRWPQNKERPIADTPCTEIAELPILAADLPSELGFSGVHPTVDQNCHDSESEVADDPMVLLPSRIINSTIWCTCGPKEGMCSQTENTECKAV